MYKIFAVGLIESHSDLSRDRIDSIVGALSELFGCKITRIILKETLDRASRRLYPAQYIKRQYELQGIQKVEFLNMPAKCNWFYDINFSFCFTNRKNGVSIFRFSARLPDSNSLTMLYEQLFEILAPMLEPQWLVAGCLDKIKAVEFFTGGILSENLDKTEEKICFSISQSNLVHHKMPFLFTYNYVSKPMLGTVDSNSINAIEYHDGFLISYPFDCNVSLVDYQNNNAWLSAFCLLSEADIIRCEVNEDGYREVLGAAEGMKEDKESWRNFFVGE